MALKQGKNVGAVLRDFKLGDLEDVISVVESSFTSEFDLTGFDKDRVRKTAQRMYSRRARLFLGLLRALGRQPFAFYVVEARGRVVGTTMVFIDRTHGYIANVAVHPSCRRMGLAIAMLEKAVRFTRERNKRKAVLHVISDNTAARTLYERLGFQPFEKLIRVVTNIENPIEVSAGTPFNIRQYRNTDKDALFELISKIQPRATVEVLGLDKRDLATPLIMRLFGLTNNVRWIAAIDGQIYGTIRLGWGGMTNTPSITELYVSPHERGQAVEAALLRTAVNGARGLGADRFAMQFNAQKQHLLSELQAIGRTEMHLLDGMVKQVD